jgi:hypothetical protein
MPKFKIGQLVHVRSSARSRGTANTEYRIVQQLTLEADQVIRYRVRNSADDQDEIVVKESEIISF